MRFFKDMVNLAVLFSAEKLNDSSFSRTEAFRDDECWLTMLGRIPLLGPTLIV